MMLKYFIESRKPHRPYLNTAQSLASKAGVSLIMAQEVQYGLYNPLPPSFHGTIDPLSYDQYRAETRRLFGEAFDAPAFTTFVSLADYFDASIQEVAKCLCIQRSLMQMWDRKIQTGTRPRIDEITEAFVTSFGPEYAFKHVLGQALPTPSRQPST